MNRMLSRSGMAFAAWCVLLTTVGCQRAAQAPATADPAADEAAIRTVLDGIAAAFNAGKMDEMLAFYEDDVLVSAPGAPDIVGKAAWQQGLDTTLPKGVPMKLRFDTAELLVSGDLAYERGTYSLAIGDPASPAQSVDLGGRHIHMFRRQADGSWKGWRLMENSEDPATSPVPAAAAAGG